MTIPFAQPEFQHLQTQLKSDSYFKERFDAEYQTNQIKGYFTHWNSTYIQVTRSLGGFALSLSYHNIRFNPAKKHLTVKTRPSNVMFFMLVFSTLGLTGSMYNLIYHAEIPAIISFSASCLFTLIFIMLYVTSVCRFKSALKKVIALKLM